MSTARLGSGAGRARVHKSRGQALVEFALVLPVLLALLGASVDLARVYGAWVALEGATRNGALAAAHEVTVADARRAGVAAVCGETRSVPGYTGNGTTCSNPAVAVTWRSTGVPGGGAGRIHRSSVTASLTFRTLVPWPLVGSPITVRSRATYEVLVR